MSVLLPLCTAREGMYVDLGFFKDVIIPPHGMPEPSFWKGDDEASNAAATNSRGKVGCSCSVLWLQQGPVAYHSIGISTGMAMHHC